VEEMVQPEVYEALYDQLELAAPLSPSLFPSLSAADVEPFFRDLSE
jgi:hypothetical protein